jgi:hypothetical protein
LPSLSLRRRRTSPLQKGIGPSSDEAVLPSCPWWWRGGCERRNELSGWSSMRLEICHTARRRSLEDEGRHTRKGSGGDAQAGSVGRTRMGSARPPLWPVGSSMDHSLRARCPVGFVVRGSKNS